MRVINTNTRSKSVNGLNSIGAYNRSSASQSFILGPNEEYDLIPKVKSIKQYTNEDGVTDHYLTIDFYCLVDVNKINNSDCKEIELRLSKKTPRQLSTILASNIISKAAKKALVKANENKEDEVNLSSLTLQSSTEAATNFAMLSKNSRNANPLLSPITVTSLINSQAIYNLKKLVKPKVINTKDKNRNIEKYITKFNVNYSTKVGTQIKKPIKKKIKIDESLKNKINENNTALYESVNQALESYSQKFQEKHTNFFSKGIDPLFLFENTLKKISYTDKKKGRYNPEMSIVNSIKLYSSFTSHLEAINAYIRLNEEEYTRSSKIVNEIQSFIQLKSEVTIGLNELRQFGSNLNFIFYAKNNNGINIESSNLTISINKILEQIFKSSKNFKINSLRKNTGVSKLTIQNKSSNNLRLRLLYKTYTDYNSLRKKNFLFLDNINLQKNNLISYNSGYSSSNIKRIKRDKIKSIDSALYRTLLTYSNIDFDNANSTSDKGIKLPVNNVPEISISTVVSDSDDRVDIYLRNISTNIAEFKVFKWDLTKSGARSKRKEIFSSLESILSNPPEPEGFIKSNQSSFIAFDYDVFDGKNYEYGVECKLKNGEIKTINKTSNIKFDKRSNLISVSLVNSDINNFENDEIENQTKSITYEIKVEKIETEVDKILRSVFGEIFELFSDDLKQIKDIQNFSYSVLVERVNLNTGEKVKVGTFQVESELSGGVDGRCIFTDDNVPDDSNIIHVVTPRIALTSDVVAQTNELIESIGKRQGNNKVNFSYASVRKRSKSRAQRKVSSIGTKFNSFENLRKGLVTQSEYYLNEFKLDFFGNRSTGDILNLELQTVSGQANQISEYTITLDRIREIKNISKGENRSNLTNSNISSLRYFDLQFTTNQNVRNIDFYAIFISENNNVYLDGALHVNDFGGNSAKHRYLVEHKGSLGRVGYYALPVLKDGTILKPVYIGNNILE